VPQYIYRARDKTGSLRTGERFADSADILNEELAREGIYPIEIRLHETTESLSTRFKTLIQGKWLLTEELAIFARQMQLLSKTRVPIVSAIKQLATYTRSFKLQDALNGVADHIEKGKSFSESLRHFPDVFSPLVISIISIGESTGHLTEAFGNLYAYLSFEAKNRRLIKTTFRYPVFVVISILAAILVLNIFVIPTFAHFYTNLDTQLPWQTRFLIGMSTIFTRYGVYLALAILAVIYLMRRYISSPEGKARFDRMLLHMPMFGKLYRRLLLIRFTQSLAIILNSGVPISQGLNLVKTSLNNKTIENEITEAQEQIERGTSFTKSMGKIELFTPLEFQIVSVGEQNGELGASMEYICNFQSSEIEFDLKKLSDNLAPILITIISGLVLIVAMGIYLPVWNMIELVH
jgi:MSHA biogenesis protein MshG